MEIFVKILPIPGIDRNFHGCLPMNTTMKRTKFLVLIATFLLSILVAIGLPTFTASSVVAQTNGNLLISAAASLKDVLEEIKPLYQQTKPNVNINFNFGASGALQQQIENGAPADIFISAAKRQVDTLEQKGLLVAGTRTNIAKNRLVLVVPKNGVNITSFYNLRDGKIKKIATGEPRSVPAGQYAEQVLKKLKLWDQIRSKLVFANNVRQVLAFVESGNAEAGLVYSTDAKISNQVKVVVAADEKYHSPIIYPMAILKRSKNVDTAKDFAQFLASNQAKSVFKKFGFILP